MSALYRRLDDRDRRIGRFDFELEKAPNRSRGAGPDVKMTPLTAREGTGHELEEDHMKIQLPIDSSGLTFIDVMPLDRVHDCQTRLTVSSCAGLT
jgi:hypothetical protein